MRTLTQVVIVMMAMLFGGSAFGQYDPDYKDYDIGGGGGGGCYLCYPGIAGSPTHPNARCDFYPSFAGGQPVIEAWHTCTVMGAYCLTNGGCWVYISTRAGKEKAIESTLAVLQLLKIPVDDLIANAPDDPDAMLAAYLKAFTDHEKITLKPGVFPIPPEARTPGWWRS